MNTSRIHVLYEAAQKATIDTLGCDSGVTAVWCRVHGDCTGSAKAWNDGDGCDNALCPLHGNDSDHADDAAARGRARASLAAMVEEHPQTVMTLVEAFWAAKTGDAAAHHTTRLWTGNDCPLCAAIEKVEALG